MTSCSIEVVNKRHGDFDVYIGRGSVWGTPSSSAGTVTERK